MKGKRGIRDRAGAKVGKKKRPWKDASSSAGKKKANAKSCNSGAAGGLGNGSWCVQHQKKVFDDTSRDENLVHYGEGPCAHVADPKTAPNKTKIVRKDP